MHGKGLRITVAAFVAALGFGLVAPAIGAQTTPAPPVTKKVTVNDNYFKPKKVTLAVGDKVTWKWKGFSAHNVTVLKGPQKFESRTQSSGRFSRVIKKPGVYKIVCTLHPGMTMSLRAT